MVLPVIIAGQAILHGLRIAGLRILPYIVREATKKSATYAAKKVGQKSITEAGYVVITKDPTKFKLAQKIFTGKHVKVIRNEKLLQAQSTAQREIVPLTQKILKSASPEVRTTILNQADDAANGISKFIAHPRSNPVIGGTKEVTKEFKKFFGKDWKPINKNTIEAIKITERGPLSLSKEVATFVPKTTKWVKSPTQSTSAQAAKEATKKKIQEFKGTKLAEEIKNVPIKQIVKTEKRPWYVNIMPKYLRTTKDVRITGPEKIPYTGAPYSIRTVTEGVAKGRLASTVGGGYSIYEGGKYMSRNIDGTDEVRSGIDLNDSDLFETESQMYDQEEIASGINIYDTDEQGNVIQAQ
jgi:hypothetical protein